MPLTRIKSTGIANTESYTLGSASITGNLTVSSVTDLGNVGNVRITGGVADYVLRTDGSGNLSWVAQTGGGGDGTDTYARQTANAAFIQANAAFAIANTGGGGTNTTSLVVLVDSFVANGNTTTFTLSTTPESKNYTSVIVDGVSQLLSTYSISNNIIIFDSSFANGSNIQVTTFAKSPGADNLGYFNRTYNGDNTTTSFAVTFGVTNNSIIVTENGIIQSPNTHYYVSGNNVIFRIAPTSTINIGIRELASTGNITAGSGGSGAGTDNVARQTANAAFAKANTSFGTSLIVSLIFR
jgi:hypothetical protein